VKDNFTNIIKQVEKGEEISPFLFLGENSEMLDAQISQLATSILLDSYLSKKSPEIFSYFFRNKLEKDDYLKFLKNMILYSKKYGVFLDLLIELDEDINLIQGNNVNAKYIVDKYLLKI